MTDYRPGVELIELNKTMKRIAKALEKIAADAEPITSKPNYNQDGGDWILHNEW